MIEKPRARVRSRCFSFIISTCGDLPEERFNNLKGVEFIIYQEKISTSSKTRYFQGVIRYINQKDFLALKKEIGFNAQLEIVRNKNDMIFFCQKLQETKSHIYTIGNVPQPIMEKKLQETKSHIYTIGNVPQPIMEKKLPYDEFIYKKLQKRINDNNFHRLRREMIMKEIEKKNISFEEVKIRFSVDYKSYKSEIHAYFEKKAQNSPKKELFILNIVSEPGLGKTVFIREFCKFLDLKYDVIYIDILNKYYRREAFYRNALIFETFLPTEKTFKRLNEYADDAELNFVTKRSGIVPKVDFISLISNRDIEYVKNKLTPSNYEKTKKRINFKMNFSTENDRLVISMESYDIRNFGSLLHKKTFTIQTRFLETDNIEAMKTIVDMMISNYKDNKMTNLTFLKKLELARMKLEETSL